MSDVESPSNHQLDKRLAVVENTIIRLHDDLKSINTVLKAIALMMAGALVTAFMQWILRGGLGG
jgi:hypothetical protein